MSRSGKEFGAVGDGMADDTAALQAAIDAGPGEVLIPEGTYLLTRALRLRPDLTLTGVSPRVSILRQTAPEADCLSGTDVHTLRIDNLGLEGPASGTGTGLRLDRQAEPNTRYVTLQDLYIRQFGRDGVDVSNAIVSAFTRVVAENNGRHGLYLHGVPGGAAGTSVSLVACYGNTNAATGIYLYNMVYSSLNACASEGHPANYLLQACQSVSVLGCGAEFTAPGGDGFVIDGGFCNVLVSCWNYENAGRAYLVTGGAYAITLAGIVENTPVAGARAALVVDEGCRGVNAFGLSYESPLLLAPGSTTVLDRSTVTGSRDGNAALAGLLAALDGMGLITDATSP